VTEPSPEILHCLRLPLVDSQVMVLAVAVDTMPTAKAKAMIENFM
jgi:hypothetical protein